MGIVSGLCQIFISYVIKFKYISNKIPNYVTAKLSSYMKNDCVSDEFWYEKHHTQKGKSKLFNILL